MVLYHWMNYFVGVEGPVYPYLRFVPASFIFISGLILASVYPAKYGLRNSSLYIRLLVRGIKILALFTLLNIAANMLFSGNYRGAISGVDEFVSNAACIYIGGNGKAAFSILVPISYLLLFSTLIFRGMLVTKYAPLIICAALFFCVFSLNYFGGSSLNLSLLAIGIFGMLVGQYPLWQMSNWAGRWCVLPSLYVAYLIAINIWGERYLLEIIGVCLSVVLIYGVGVRITPSDSSTSILTLLGKHSLFAYIAQIGLLQLLQASLAMANIPSWRSWTFSFIGAFALTIMAVWVVHQTCARSSTVDRMYRFVFA